MKVYVVDLHYDYADDGYSILGVFSTREKAEQYIEKTEPQAIKTADGDYELERGENKFTDWMFYEINEFEVDKGE